MAETSLSKMSYWQHAPICWSKKVLYIGDLFLTPNINEQSGNDCMDKICIQRLFSNITLSLIPNLQDFLSKRLFSITIQQDGDIPSSLLI